MYQVQNTQQNASPEAVEAFILRSVRGPAAETVRNLGAGISISHILSKMKGFLNVT